jgi:peptide/nickel transport system permease protein
VLVTTVTAGTIQAAEAPPEEPAPSILGRLTGSFTLRRLVKALFTVWFVATATFLLLRLMPGNPVDTFIATQINTNGMSRADASALAAGLFAFNPSETLLAQYGSYITGLAHGDLGVSITSPGTTVATVIKIYLPWTLFCVGVATLISFAIGLFCGIVMAYRRGSWLDHLLTTVGSILGSIPDYLIAIFVLVVIGVKFGLFNVASARGAVSPGLHANLSLDFLSDILYHASLPILCYVLASVGHWALLMKSSTTETLGEDYVTVARARGLSDARIRFGYVGRNAVLPLVTQLAVTLGFVVGGSIFVETFFKYPGIGSALFAALQSRDYTVLQGIFLIITVSVVVANLLADILYSRLDPRIRVASTVSE